MLGRIDRTILTAVMLVHISKWIMCADGCCQPDYSAVIGGQDLWTRLPPVSLDSAAIGSARTELRVHAVARERFSGLLKLRFDKIGEGAAPVSACQRHTGSFFLCQ